MLGAERHSGGGAEEQIGGINQNPECVSGIKKSITMYAN